MRSKSMSAAFSPHFSQKRIARSLVSILVLTFLVTVTGPVLLPIQTSNSAEAATLYGNVSNFLQWNTWMGGANHRPYINKTTTQISSNGDELKLTAKEATTVDGDQYSASGFIWNSVPTTTDFSVSAEYWFGSSDAGADGIAFLMRPLSAYPNGGTLGATGSSYTRWESANSVAVIFDTYQNGTEINEDHLTVLSRNSLNQETIYTGNGLILKDSSGSNDTDIEDGSWKQYTISWTMATKTLTVSSGTLGGTQYQIASYSMSNQTASSYYWGWVGFTGGATSDYVVKNVNFNQSPVITSQPNDVTTDMGNSATFSAGYSTVDPSPTLVWQEQLPGSSTWSDIAGANSSSYTFTATRAMTQKKFRLSVSNSAANQTLTTYSNEAKLVVNGPNGDRDYALDSSNTRYATVSNATPVLPGTNVATYTLEAWIKPDSTCDGTYYCSVFANESSYLLQVYKGYLTYIIGSGSAWCNSNARTEVPKAPTPSGRWYHIALVRNSNNVKIYLNGLLVHNLDSSCNPTTQTANTVRFGLGIRGAGSEYFYGKIDEARIWNTDRGSSIASDMNSTETSTTGLLDYWNFNEGSGSTVYNLAAGALSSTDLTMSTTTAWDWASIESQTAYGPFTISTFTRTYLTLQGGWKRPTQINGATVLVAGGGGGGGYNTGGGGSGGGVRFQSFVNPDPYTQVIVGVGGNGAIGSNSTVDYQPSSGGSSSFGNISCVGGNPGINFSGSGGVAGGAAISSGSCSSGAGGISAYNNGSTTVAAGAGSSGVSTTAFSSSAQYFGGGGGGGGYNASPAGGAGTPTTGGGGAGGTNSAGGTGLANSGGGGGGSSSQNCLGGSGGSGVVLVKYITSATPIYTRPTNAYLNLGMTETFTTNVAQDSATALLTRTFKWESTTPSANGVYTLIKQGTGATNAAFSWIPSDTSTSGSGYLYRLTITDSDTAGLLVTDSSTAFAVINQPLKVSGLSTIPKKINLSRSETFTISLGTPTYRVSYTNINSGISIDTSSASNVVFTISETLTVGTYYETLTVTDSVSASIATPLTFMVAAPPNLVNTADIVSNGLIFNIDFANSASYNRATGGVSDLSGSQKTVTTSGSPSFKEDYLGFLKLETATNQFISAVGFTTLNAWTIDAYVRVDVKPTSAACLVSNQQNTASSTQNFNLCVDPGLTVWAGFFNGSLWTYKRTVETIAVGSWVHIVAEWSGLTSSASTGMLIWFNGVATTSTDSPTNATTAQPMTTNRVFIGRSSNSTANNYASISVGYVRIYNRGLSLAEVTQNFNATKNRFTAANVDLSFPSRKYGNLTSESLTATSGVDARTVTFQIGDRSGIDWDTSTVNTVKLKMFETLTAGTYYDTVTVTDSLGQSSYVPFTMTSNKADTLTITMPSSVTMVYSGTAPPNPPIASITGLVSTDSASVQTQYSGTYSDGTLTCAQGGTCVVGNIGPGGGTVFYVGSSEINTSSGVSPGGKYLEIAPANWNGSSDGGTRLKWSEVTTAVSGLSSGIGAGAENTRLIAQALGADATAANAALNLTFGGKTDWFMPSIAEMKVAYDSLTALNINTITGSTNYWVSEENPADRTQGMYIWSSSPASSGPYSKILTLSMRPIRAFSSSYFSTATPTEVDTYTAKGTVPVFSSGALSNYQGIIYETSTLKITQANQNKLVLNLYGAVAGQPFALVTTGGSGTGAITETVTAGGNATNCQVSNRILTNTNSSTDQKFCRVTVTKAASRNYKSESLTADVYFMVFINDQPTGLVGSGSTIALNGMTSLTVENPATNTAPMITGATLSGGVLTITGYGFGSSPVTIRFYRYVPAATMPTPTLSGSIYTIQVAVPAGAQDGPVEVISATGEAVTDDIDVTP